jgi:hypothetical protein
MAVKLSVALTINERPTPVLDAVFGSLRKQPFDELVIVLDRSPREVIEHVHDYWAGDKRFVPGALMGEPGWRSPVPAWNAAFALTTGDHLYAFSSEVVHAPQNLAVARRLLAENPNTLIFGKAMCSCGPDGGEVNWGGQAPSNLLVDAAHPRPLGFIWAGPMANVRQIGGMDMEFRHGLWHDDDSYFYDLWKTGLNFLFTDEISGVHLHHDRPVLATEAGQRLINTNRAYMLRKHGTLTPWSGTPRLETRQPRVTVWRHP